MMYDEEIVRKNMKYMRKLYGVTQGELAEVINATQHGVSYFETGKRGLNYQIVQTLANYFRLPIEQFVKEDLAEMMVLSPSRNLEFMFELLEIVFPIFKSTKALQDEQFKRGYEILHSIMEASRENKQVSVAQMESCIEAFVKSYNTSYTIEAVANVLGFVLWVYAPAFDKEKQDIGEAIYKENEVSKTVLKEHFLRKNITIDPVKEEFIEDNSEFVMDGIQVLKSSPKWSELGDYYLAIRYIVGIVDNEHNDDMNLLIGEELMYALVELKNKYATAYWNKKYGFFKEKE